MRTSRWRQPQCQAFKVIRSLSTWNHPESVTFTRRKATYGCKHEVKAMFLQICHRGKKTMSREVKQIMNHRSRPSSRKQASASPATCLLCRVLWPLVVKHRHLIFDSSSEAKTDFLPQRRLRVNSYASRCSLRQLTARSRRSLSVGQD